MHEVRSFDRGVTRHRADAQCAVFEVDGTEFRDTVNVDEHGRPRQPHIDERHEALTARQYSGVAAALRQQLNCLSNTRGAEIVEGGRHAEFRIARAASWRWRSAYARARRLCRCAAKGGRSGPRRRSTPAVCRFLQWRYRW